ncbi:MAG: PA14 domain-containing protein [Chloroflexota bacterium]
MRRIWILMVVLMASLSFTANATAQERDLFTASWNADYFDNPYLLGEPVFSRTEDSINVNWGENIPTVNVPADNFSVRWTKSGNLPSGTYRFIVTASVGFRVYVDGNLIIDAWSGANKDVPTGYDYEIEGGDHSIQVDYFALDGDTYIYLDWGLAPNGEVPPQPLTDEDVDENTVSVIVNILNVRNAPRIANNIIEQIYVGERFRAIGRSEDGRWLLIDLGNGTQGWISAAFAVYVESDN